MTPTVGDTIKQRSPLAAEIVRVVDMLEAAKAAGPFSATTAALRRARNALVVADVCCCDSWTVLVGRDREGLVDLIGDTVEARDRFSASEVEWDAALVWRSDRDAEVHRLVVADREWVVYITTEGGYGDDGTGTRECVTILARGEVRR